MEKNLDMQKGENIRSKVG